MSRGSLYWVHEQQGSGIGQLLGSGLGVSLSHVLDVLVLLESQGFELLLGDLAGVQASQDRLL